MSKKNWEIDEPLYAIFRQIVEERSGLQLHLTDRHIFESKVVDKIKTRGFRSITEYAEFLRFDRRGESEATFLIDQITNNETYFFREPAHFELLKHYLIPELLKKNVCPIKIWSAGCATGEEPYTIAIIIYELLKFYGDFAYQIIGTDIDMTVLKKAGVARYSRNSFRGVNPDIIRTYFSPVDNEWQLRPEIIQMVDFRHLNLVNGEFPAGDLTQIDIIFYRNVSIYFRPETNQRILVQLYDTLREASYLLPGTTETMQYRSNPFSLRERNSIFFLQKISQPIEPAVDSKAFTAPQNDRLEKAKTTPIRPALMSAVLPKPLPPREIATTTFPSSPASTNSAPKKFTVAPKTDALQQAIEFLNENRFNEAATVLHELLEEKMQEEEAWLLLANIHFNRGNMSQAETFLEKVLMVNDIRPEAFLLLGMIKKNLGDYSEARRVFQKALFLQGSLWVANFHLAEIYRITNEMDKARREYSNALKNSQKKSDANWALYFAGFSQDYMIRICERNLQSL